MRFTPAAKEKRQAQREALESGAETFVWPCAIHGEQAESDSRHGGCIGCRQMTVEARQAKRDKAAAALAEKHKVRPPKRFLGLRREEALEASARAYQERKEAESRTRIAKLREEWRRYEIEREQRKAQRMADADTTERPLAKLDSV
ncbi:hypothetical protein [Burkholderia sp. Ac-20353]|uniref:hypothetical protein n=1 Tax=Burkholderia sp. Ac-20353 TaxID=2703894 RepID=UPI00197BF863|nr:hypothetical protein [Burkholderia sp. Ac-20353]MBN3791870.1 hypothetical protein [Burkholderia sp. Ac-20353]